MAISQVKVGNTTHDITLKGLTVSTDEINTTYPKILSKGEQLVANGNGLMGDNTNFSSWTFDGANANNSAGSFTRASKGTISTNEYFPVNPSKKYRLDIDAKSANNLATLYSYLDCYDIDKNQITAGTHIHRTSSTTTLAKDLKSGDTVAYLTDVSGWSPDMAHGYYMILWNYTNSKGYTYPAGTYSRNRVVLPSSSNKLPSSAINTTNKTITLKSAYSGATIPAGTPVSQGGDGSTYKYIGAVNSKVPINWTTYTGYMDGVDLTGTNAGSKFPPATAFCRVGFLWNYNGASDQLWITNVSVTCNVTSEEINTALGNKLTANGWATNANSIYTTDNSEYISYTKTGISWSSDSIQTGGTINFPRKSGRVTLATLDDITSASTGVTVDNALSTTSTNPVQNKVVTSALNGKYSSSNPPPYPVTSVAGKTGAVTLAKGDVGLGNVENKSSATIRGELTKANVTTALGYTPPTENTKYSAATTSTAGLMSAADKTKLDGIATGANNFSLPYRLASYQASGTGSVNDPNNATETGFYYVSSSSTNRPPFSQSSNLDYRLLVTAYGTTWLQQIATDFRCDDIFYRRKDNGTWKPWVKIYPTNTDTTYDLGASKSSTNGNVKLNLVAGGSGSGTDSVTIKGTGGTTVTTDANGVVTINSSATTSSSVTVDSALSSTSTNPVQNKVVNAALNNKLTANGWSTNSTGALVYGANDSKQIQIRRDYIYLMNDSEQTETILRFPTGNKNSTIATIEDIQSYIDTAILGGSW